MTANFAFDVKPKDTPQGRTYLLYRNGYNDNPADWGVYHQVLAKKNKMMGGNYEACVQSRNTVVLYDKNGNFMGTASPEDYNRYVTYPQSRPR